MKTSRVALLLLSAWFLGLSTAWAEPTFWENAPQSPTPIPPPRLAPLPVEKEGVATPTPVVAPSIPEIENVPEPVEGKSAKRPRTAGWMSAVLPGSGHVYAGEPIKGLFFAGAFGLTLWQSVDNLQKLQPDYREKNATAGQIYGLAALVTYGFCVQDAFDSARRYNRRYHLKWTLEPKAGPYVRVALSF